MIVSQPSVNAADYSTRRSAPHLRKRISGEDELIRSSFGVADVLGIVDADRLQASLEEICQARLMTIDASSRSYKPADHEMLQLLCTIPASFGWNTIPLYGFEWLTHDIQPVPSPQSMT